MPLILIVGIGTCNSMHWKKLELLATAFMEKPMTNRSKWKKKRKTDTRNCCAMHVSRCQLNGIFMPTCCLYLFVSIVLVLWMLNFQMRVKTIAVRHKKTRCNWLHCSFHRNGNWNCGTGFNSDLLFRLLYIYTFFFHNLSGNANIPTHSNRIQRRTEI